MKNYFCEKCKTLVTSNQPPYPHNCPSGGNHKWTDLGEVGNDTYQCGKCGLVVKSKNMPYPFSCPNGGTHQWNKPVSYTHLDVYKRQHPSLFSGS